MHFVADDLTCVLLSLPAFLFLPFFCWERVPLRVPYLRLPVHFPTRLPSCNYQR